MKAIGRHRPSFYTITCSHAERWTLLDFENPAILIRALHFPVYTWNKKKKQQQQQQQEKAKTKPKIKTFKKIKTTFRSQINSSRDVMNNREKKTSLFMLQDISMIKLEYNVLSFIFLSVWAIIKKKAGHVEIIRNKINKKMNKNESRGTI